MNEEQALQLMARLIVATNGWDEARVRGWTMMLMDLTDHAAASRAVEAVCKTWTAASAPPWGKLQESYQAQPRTSDYVLPSATGPAMSFHAYLSRLQAKALEGSHEKARELAQWKHYVGTSNTWLKAIGGDE